MQGRPACLLLDTDVLIQLFIGRAHQAVLSSLKQDFGIQSLVVPEVEAEVTYTKKFGTRFQPDFRKARTSGLIRVLDSSSYTTILSDFPELQKSAAGISYGDIQQLGARYNVRSDRGEAYTHASAVMLGQPAASNDITAINALNQAGERLPNPVLRSFDLLVFAHQNGSMTEADCNKVCKRLRSEGEILPWSFRNNSFVDGLKDFVPRLIDGGSNAVGAKKGNRNAPQFAMPLTVTKPT